MLPRKLHCHLLIITPIVTLSLSTVPQAFSPLRNHDFDKCNNNTLVDKTEVLFYKYVVLIFLDSFVV